MNALTPQSRSARKMIKEECDERLKLLPVYMTASWTMVLLDKGHIEACEMQEILVEVEKLYQSITGNYISFEDVCRAVETEYGVRLNFVDNIKDKNPWLRKIADKNPAQKTLPLPADPNEDALVQKALAEKDAKIEALQMDNAQLQSDNINANMNCEHLQAEIERLQKLLEGWKTEAYKVADEKDKLYCEAVERVRTAKSEAYKEIIEKLKSKLCICDDNFNPVVTEKEIDDTFKEMVAMINEKHI